MSGDQQGLFAADELDVLANAFSQIQGRHQLGQCKVQTLDVMTMRTNEHRRVRDCIEAFAPDEGWAIDIGRNSKATAFWRGSPDGVHTTINGQILEGEFVVRQSGSSLDVRHVGGQGWVLTFAVPTGERLFDVDVHGFRTRWINIPFLVTREAFLAVFGEGDPTNVRPTQALYNVAWQDDECGSLSPRVQMFAGFFLPGGEIS